MKTKSKLLLIVLMLLISKVAWTQVSMKFTQKSIVAEKWRGEELIIPIEIKIENDGKGSINSQVLFSITNGKTSSNSSEQMSTSRIDSIDTRGDKQTVKIPGSESLLVTFYIVLDKNFPVSSTKKLTISATMAKTSISKEVTLKQGPDITYTLTDYLDSDLKLNIVNKVESKNNILTVYGFKDDNHAKINLMLDPYEALAVKEWSFMGSAHWYNFPLSIAAIPFKIRPALSIPINDPRSTLSIRSKATAGLTNIGLNLDLGKLQLDRYFANGQKSTHKFALGIWAAPSVEEMDSTSTLGFLSGDEVSQQLFFSTGLTISYTYNDLSFMFVPIGMDVGGSTVAKNWIYNKERWWGFGIAISPKILAPIINK